MRSLALVLMLVGAPAAAQDFPISQPLPECVPAMRGRAMCRDGMAFECRLVGPGAMQRDTGWLWEANILLPCDPEAAPADLPGGRSTELPPGFSYAPQFDTRSGQGQNAPPGMGRSRRGP